MIYVYIYRYVLPGIKLGNGKPPYQWTMLNASPAADPAILAPVRPNGPRRAAIVTGRGSSIIIVNPNTRISVKHKWII